MAYETKCIGNCGKSLEVKREGDSAICKECREAWARIKSREIS